MLFVQTRPFKKQNSTRHLEHRRLLRRLERPRSVLSPDTSGLAAQFFDKPMLCLTDVLLHSIVTRYEADRHRLRGVDVCRGFLQSLPLNPYLLIIQDYPQRFSQHYVMSVVDRRSLKYPNSDE
jgi:hypothetical protein